MNTVNVYGCGGAGINIAKKYLKELKKTTGFAKVVPFFIDTSMSNISTDINPDSVYLMDGLDGSGKKRDSNYAAIRERSKEIIQKFKPSELNIVIHSGSGGSGSVLGPILASEISDKYPTVIILIGSSDSRIETDNTIKTIQSYEVISQNKSHPMPVMYYENTTTHSRGVVDNSISIHISLLSILFSGDNAELDTADLSNFLNYQKVTTYKPSLSMLTFFSKDITLERDQHAASIATLVNKTSESKPNIRVEYQCTGYISDEAEKYVDADRETTVFPLHAVMVVGYFHDKIAALTKELEEYDTHRSTVVQKPLVDKSIMGTATSDGMIF